MSHRRNHITITKLFILHLFLLMICGAIDGTGSDFFQNLKEDEEKKPLHKCFCKLEGAVNEDCSCPISDIDKFNNLKIYPRLQSLLCKDYFRYFQMNLKKPCPLWSDDGACGLESCQVKACSEDEIPIGLKGHKQAYSVYKVKEFIHHLCFGDGSSSRWSLVSLSHAISQNAPADVSNLSLSNILAIRSRPQCSSKDGCTEDLGSVNETISEESLTGFERWKVHDENLVDFCTVKDDMDPNAQYVDLLLNPERYTGYAGPSAHRIWRSIYNENCFQQPFTTSIMEPFNKSNGGTLLNYGYDDDQDTCIEKRAFYRAISGLHASINIHVSSRYLLTRSKVLSSQPQWGLNLTEFRNKFDKPEANEEGFGWLKNLYFLYLLELRAIFKAAPFLKNFNFYTGNQEEDADVKLAISDLLRIIDSFPSHFDESALFSNKDGKKLKAEFHGRFTNITRIMDCVGCQKCKLWGTIQIKGLGTALKILFSDEVAFKRGSEFLSRTEVVSLINAFGRLSTSIHELENIRRIMQEGNEELGSGRTSGRKGYG